MSTGGPPFSLTSLCGNGGGVVSEDLAGLRHRCRAGSQKRAEQQLAWGVLQMPSPNLLPWLVV